MTPPSTAALMSLAGAAWLCLAAVATYLGLTRSLRARRVEADARAVAGLLEAAPAVPMLIHADGRIETSSRAAAWLGLDVPPRDFNDLLDGGFDRDRIAQLEATLIASLETGKRFAEYVRLPGTRRVVCFSGGPYAAAGVSDRAVLAWLTDVSASSEQIDRLSAETRRLSAALDGLSTLIEAAPFPMWYRGPDLQLALVNSAFVRAVEAESAAEVVRRGMELIETGNEGTAQQVARTTLARGVISTRTAPAIITGERRVMRVVDVPVGEIGVAGFAMDVQELEDARADLGRFVRAQRDMLDRLSAGVAQFGPDQGLVFYNRYFMRLFDLDPDWLSDRPEFDRVLERMREAQRAPEIRDFPSWRSERRGWFLAHEPVEENWQLPGGTHLRVVGQPLPDGGLLLIFEDRTEHLQLASARDTLLRVRAATFENLFEAIGVFAADGRLHLWNNRFRDIWGMEEGALVQHPRVDMLVQALAPRLQDPSRAGMVRELVRTATIDRQQRSGRIALNDGRHFEFAAVPLPDGNALFTLLDITASRGIEEALRERNDALEQANSLKNAFVSSMSYELRVPLTSIAGFAEMLAAGYAGELPPSAREYVDAILSAVTRLSTLMGDALDLSQSEAGSLPLEAEAVNVGELVREAARFIAEPANAAGLTVAIDVTSGDQTVQGDRRRLRQVMDHLLRNAVAYTSAGGRILVRSRIVGRSAEIVVSDNGRGIPDHKVERIFDRLSRESTGDGDTAGRRGGGVGLPLSRQLVEAHGGTIRIESEIGRGTSVYVLLPLGVQAVAA
ncbi:PAS domain-containing protein [Sphingomonas sp. AP4-R1]|uniref:PAS domain-containing sensor histidine kinase n=1 Tax=Sphingomonas sp. AP4-R1 TaxID=2735134 RepID=UPI001493D526|nr:PAS domain-containing sensor histidine kinase [Sphingomonas sp. AP4-R1]QJU59781.1 PAS domain-containing protein [Sphingomonas sp. AP4-R1]